MIRRALSLFLAALTLWTASAAGVDPAWGQIIHTRGAASASGYGFEVVTGSASATFQALIVGGGGSSGTATAGAAAGGGSGGQVLPVAGLMLTSGAIHTITVGAGGVGANSPLTNGGNGGSSSIDGVVAIGGGGGGGGTGGASPSGAYGGGGAGGTGTFPGGVGLVANQGGASNNSSSGGGGGAGGSGFNGVGGGAAGNGGPGVSNSITGSSVVYGGGGGGGNAVSPNPGGVGGSGGGGNGGCVGCGSPAVSSGTPNTGGGGGGCSGCSNTAGTPTGGSGVVIISYPTAYGLNVTATGSFTQTTSGANTIYTFTGSGTFSFTTGVLNSPARGWYLPQDTFFGENTAVIGAGSDSTAYTYSFWVFGLWDVATSGTGSPTGGMNGGILFSADPTTHYEVTAGASPGLGMTFENPNAIVFNFNNTPGTNDATDTVKFLGTASSTAPIKGQWNHYLVSWDSASGKWAFYRNGVDLSGSVSAVIRSNAKFNLFNPNGFVMNGYLNTTGSGALSSSWMADVWVAQTYIGNTANAGANTIPPATLAKFIDGSGHAVDLKSDGSGPLGVQPALFIGDRGDGIPTQRGAATASMAYGPVQSVPSTGYAVGAPASYGPGAAIPSRIVMVTQPSQFGFGNVTSYSVTSNGQPVNDGDLVVIASCGNDSVSRGNHSPSVTSHTGFTTLNAGYDTFEDQECDIFYKKLAAGEGNPAGISVTIGQALGYDRGTATVMFVYRNVTSIDQAILYREPTNTNLNEAVPAGNATQNQTLLSLYTNRSADPGAGPVTITPPASGQVRHRTRRSQPPFMMLVEEPGVLAGGSYRRVAVRSGTTAGDTWFAASLGLVP